MKYSPLAKQAAFTLIEVMVALVILSAMSLISYRGLSAILDSRDQVSRETEKWRHLSIFFARFEQDIQHVAPYPLRGQSDNPSEPRLEFRRFASNEGVDAPRRIAYQLNEQQEIELWIWSGLDAVSDEVPAHYTVLRGASAFELQYMSADLQWVNQWPNATNDADIPRAVQLRIVMNSGESILRIFSLKS